MHYRYCFCTYRQRTRYKSVLCDIGIMFAQTPMKQDRTSASIAPTSRSGGSTLKAAIRMNTTRSKKRGRGPESARCESLTHLLEPVFLGNRNTCTSTATVCCEGRCSDSHNFTTRIGINQEGHKELTRTPLRREEQTEQGRRWRRLGSVSICENQRDRVQYAHPKPGRACFLPSRC